MDDLPAMVRLLTDDPLGSQRESATDIIRSPYLKAFQAIHRDTCHQLIVGCMNNVVIALLQLSFIPHLTYQGGWRAQIEGVRVAPDRQGSGIGKRLIEHAIHLARERQCHLIQLTTDHRRPDALRFYQQLGFKNSHHGMKLHF